MDGLFINASRSAIARLGRAGGDRDQLNSGTQNRQHQLPVLYVCL
jgi:hypothetical protein